MSTPPPSSPPPKLTQLIAVLAVQDFRKSAAFYTEKLGFTVDHADECWVMLERDGARIHIGNCPEEKPAWETGLHNWFATILVNDLPALENEFRKKEVPFLRGIKEMGGGWTDFVIQTPDGHRLVFGHLAATRDREQT